MAADKPLLLVDGSSYLFRAFHALPDLSTADGFPTGALFGVINMLRKLGKDFEGSPVAVVSTGSRLLVRTISIRSCRATALRVSPSRMSSSRDCAPRSSRRRWKNSSGSVMRHLA